MEEPNDRESDPRRALFLRQCETLRLFLRNGAITRAQYEKSHGDLCRLMNMKDEKTEEES